MIVTPISAGFLAAVAVAWIFLLVSGASRIAVAASTIVGNVGLFPAIAAPVIPSRIFVVTPEENARNGKTLNTEAIQRAMDDCARAGGGRVVVPAGRYLTGPIRMGSDMELHLERGATIVFSDDPKVFKLSRYSKGQQRFEDCPTAEGCHDVKDIRFDNVKIDTPERPILHEVRAYGIRAINSSGL